MRMLPVLLNGDAVGLRRLSPILPKLHFRQRECSNSRRGVAQFLQHQIIQCAYCSLPLDQNVLPALLTKDALKAWQDAMCTAAALESERETELRLRASIEIAQHPDAVLLADIAGMVLPKCPKCQTFLPAFDGCSALQCGNISGKLNRALGCGAHVCSWCQKECPDGGSCHGHVLSCMFNPRPGYCVVVVVVLVPAMILTQGICIRNRQKCIKESTGK